ncbi:hypothetical protein QTN25_004962 [Entamoeba marina]
MNDIPLLFLKIFHEKNKNISLPSTLTYLCIESCSNCSFSFKEQWSLNEIVINSSSNCIIPICNTYKYYDNRHIGKNTYENYGDVSNIEHLFQSELFETVTIVNNCTVIKMNKNAFIKEIDLSVFKIENIRLININTNKVLLGSCIDVWFTDVTIKEIIFDECNKMICPFTSTIDNIKGRYINTLEFYSKSITQFSINNINYYTTNSCHILNIPIKTIQFREFKENYLDLSLNTIITLILIDSNINKLIISSTLTLFENTNSHIQTIEGFETTNIPNEQKQRLIIKYCNGKLPEVYGKQLTLKNARAIKVDYLAIVNCKELKQIIISNTLKTLVLNQCDQLETLDLTTSQLITVNIKNCKSIKTLLVNDNVKRIINSCPLLN